MDGLEELAIAASAQQIADLWALAEWLERWSGRMNLTGHRSLEDIVRRLILDAAALGSKLPAVTNLADIGSGAGFPGLPLAILHPTLQVTLVEPRLKRHHFQRAVVRDLGIENARPLLGRAEALEPEPHQAAVAQALAPAGRALPWLIPWVVPDGWILLPGSATPAEVPEVAGVRFERCDRYRVPGGGPERSLWIGRRGAA